MSILNDLWGKYSDLDTQSPLLYHEVPFYYAMMLGHDRVLGHPDELWYQKAKCWPPPEEADARHLAFEEELMEEESDE